MGIEISPLLYTNIDTDTTILTKKGIFYGLAIVPKTTGAVSAYVYDATATATGTCIFAASMASTAGIGMNNPVMIREGVRCGVGLHIDVSCTSGADQVIVFYSKL